MDTGLTKHILFLTQVLPYPLDAGPKIRAYYTLRYLAQYHVITLVSFIRPDDPESAITHLRQYCRKVYTMPMIRSRWRDGMFFLQSILNGKPFLIQRDWVPAMATKIRQICATETFDVIHADQLWMAPYALLARDYSRNRAKAILDQHNAVFKIPMRLAENESNPIIRLGYVTETGRMKNYETQVCMDFDRVVWVTKEDRLAIETSLGQPLPSSHRFIIPICVDIHESIPRKPKATEANLLFVGGMHWPPNAEGILWFYLNVWPLISSQDKNIRLQVVGKSPPKEILNEPDVEAPGFVNDLEPYWENCAVFIVPLHAGGGMRVKILDAWRHGIPIVSTTVGAEGLAYRDGENIIIADEPTAFANAVLRILQDSKWAEQLRANGYQWVNQHYAWQKVYKAWGEVYETID